MQKKVSPLTPQPRSLLSMPERTYVIESMSGETYSPHHKRSSPVLTISVSSSGAMTCCKPSTNLAPPVPPVSTVIMPPPAHNLLRQRQPAFSHGVTPDDPALAKEIPDTPAGVRPALIPALPCAHAIVPDAAMVFQD